MKTVLFTNGLSDDRVVEVISYTNSLSYNVGGSSNIKSHISLSKCNSYSIMFDMNENSEISLPSKVDLIFNQISEPDTYIISLGKVVQLGQSLGLTILNHPRYIINTKRNRVYDSLKNKPGIIVPKTVRYKSTKDNSFKDFCKTHKFTLPIILREVGSHGGKTTHLLSTNEDIEQCNPFALRDKTYYVTQFYDYKNKDNLYIKTRLVVIGDDFFIRHTIATTHWEVHAKYRTDELEWIERESLEKFEIHTKPRISDAIKEIKTAIGLDYFGIDCCIDADYNLVIFEVNANMNILSMNGDYTDPYTIKINNAITRFIENKAEQI